MPDTGFTIRAFEADDTARISFLQPEGWEDIVPFFEFYLQVPFCRPVIGVCNEAIAGVGCAIVNGPSGWIAHIIVGDEYRRRGYGRAITEHCINGLERAGCETQLLIATAAGEPLYRALGFTTVSIYNFYHAPRIAAGTDPRIRPLRKGDAEAVFDLDRELMGEDRRHVLEWYGTGGWGFFDAPASGLRGFYLPAAGEGLIIARDDDAGTALLALKHSKRACKTVLPGENARGNEFLVSLGCDRYIEAPRMIRGRPIGWHPRALFSRIGGWYG